MRPHPSRRCELAAATCVAGDQAEVRFLLVRPVQTCNAFCVYFLVFGKATRHLLRERESPVWGEGREWLPQMALWSLQSF